MSLTCPNCKMDLPEHGGLEYRFCPRCGAEITGPGADEPEDFLTIPPDLNHAAAQDREPVPEPERNEKPHAGVPNRTLEPVIAEKGKARPVLVPPTGPPPASFFRADSPQPTISSESIQDRPVDVPRKPVKLLIIVLGAMVIWMGLMFYLLLV